MNSPSGKMPEYRDSDQYVAKSGVRKRWKRSMGLAHGRTQSELLRRSDFEGKSRFHKARDYLKIKIFQWVGHYLKSRFGGKWPFPNYTTFENDNGIYSLTTSQENADLNQPVRVSLAGDWASGTEEANVIAKCINHDSPHFTIHLGDIYYVGTKTETKENMLGGKVQWPLGSHGSFALNANHEMYARGKAYFKCLLPALGIRGGNNRKCSGQKASFFCLRNKHWLVIGLDTGYYSVGVPILEMLFKPSAKLHSKLIEWLCNDLRLQDDHQHGIILLSHHQYYSQFESGYERAAKQLAQLIDRPVLWFWGHEHRFSIYGVHATKKGKLKVYGRCIGHGGLPIEDIEDKPEGKRKHKVGLVLYDKRKRTEVAETPVGFNGYANLVFKGRRLTVEYKDNRQLLVTENWEVDDGGVLKGISIECLVEDKDLMLHEGASLNDAIA